MSDRISFAEDWQKRGSEAIDKNNVFEGFIYLWLSLTIASKQHFANNKKINRDEDEVRDVQHIKFWVSNYARADKIVGILKTNSSDMEELCGREGSETKDPIIDIKSKKSYDKILLAHENFAKYWNGEGASFMSERDVAETFIELLNKVRNNLFHGGKSFKIESDRRLLELICPSLDSIAKLCIKQARDE